MTLVTRYLLEVFNGIKTIKVSNTENKVIDIFSKYDQNIGKRDIKFFSSNISTTLFGLFNYNFLDCNYIFISQYRIQK